ncbi:MAG: hypothetical protein SGJ24_20160 [Chloroflexota bacterium]|nr:hypothetical protein [Chloroflexota bacterium]
MSLRRWLVIALLTLIGGVISVSAQDTDLTVDATRSLGAISPYVYGANYGPWGIVSIDMQPTAATAGVTHMRFPAGRWGDEHDITEGQLDLFMLQARAWGGTPSVSVRLEDGAPEQAAALVRYANIENDYAIRHWSIGNEPDLFKDYTVEQFNTEWRAIALAMEAVDPSILLLGPEVSQFPVTVAGDAYTNARREWVRAFLQANGDLVDIVAVHRYPFPETMNAPATTIAQLRANAPEWDTLIDNLRVVMREALGRELPIALTEVNSHWNHVIGGEGTPDSRYHAIWWADVLGRMIRQRVEIVNYFSLSSFGALGGFGLLDRYKVRPTYYVYQLYQQFGDDLLSSSSSDADVTITAARRDDGALTLMIVNRALEARTLPLTLVGVQFVRTLDAQLFEADQLSEAIPTLFDGQTVNMPPASITRLTIAVEDGE